MAVMVIKRQYKLAILLLLPAVIFYISRITNKSFGEYFLYCIDPEYPFLFNGLCIAQFNLDLGHFQHPGIPLQFLIAITSVIMHIGNRGLTLAEDIFVNPEYFLNTSNFSINLFNALLLSAVGYFIYKRSRKLLLALFIQTSPLANQLYIDTTGRVIPESLLGIACILLLLIVFYYITKTDSGAKINKYTMLFSIISGYGLAIKLNYIPLLIIPLIIIPSLMDKLKYLLLTIVSFFLFAFPLLGKLVAFGRWIRRLFIHSGLYGAGESNIIDISNFTHNIKLLVSDDKLLFLLLLLFILIIIIYFIKPLKFRLQDDAKYKALIGIVLAIVIQYLIVAKHYSYHYMFPSLCLPFFGIYLTIEILFRPLQKFQITNIIQSILYTSIIILFIVSSVNKVIENNLIHKQEFENRMLTSEFINNNIKDKTVLLVPWFYGSAYVERGLVEGLFYTGRYKKGYSRQLKKHYPETYFFLHWHNRYYDWQIKWNKGLDLEKFIKNNKEIYIYFGVEDINLMNRIFNDLISFSPQNTTEPKRIYYNYETKKSIYRFQ